MNLPQPPHWLHLARGSQPLILSIPHAGTEIPPDIAVQLKSTWLARKDADWWVDRLYDFAAGLGVTIVRTSLSRTVIDVNRDPSGQSLYPGQATTELCPTTTFDGEPLYRDAVPDASQIADRRLRYFDPYHETIRTEIARLRAQHRAVVLYEAHSIRSVVPRLFDGALPNFNIGTNDGKSCSPELTLAVEGICATTAFSRITNGRFKGGYTTRRYGQPAEGVHALQMELACRGYLREPEQTANEDNWPPQYDPAGAGPMRAALEDILKVCIRFAQTVS